MQLISNLNTIASKLTYISAHEEVLKTKLKQFGLNPTDWTLSFPQQEYAVITNTDELDFQFIGKLNTEKSQWEYIKLLSL